MKVVFTAEAAANLDEILTDIAEHFPDAYEGFQARVQAVLSANRVVARGGANDR